MTSTMLKAKPNTRRRKDKEEVLEDLTKEEMMRLNVQIPQSLHRRVKMMAAQKGESMTNIVTSLLEEYLRQNSNE